MLKGSKAIVTGASKGIGKSIAHKLASNGVSVCSIARNENLLKTSTNELPGDGHSYIIHDVGSTILSSPPPCNILINCAGITQHSLLHSTDFNSIQNVVNTNLIGTIAMTQAVSKQLLRRGGTVINISSILSNQYVKGTSVYSASKSGVEAFTKAMAIEYSGVRRPVKFNCLRLGLVDTDMAVGVGKELRTQFPRLLSVDEVSDKIVEMVTSDINGEIVELS